MAISPTASPILLDAPRIDGTDKVTGAARFGSDFSAGDIAYATLTLSPIARGRISRIDDRAARAVRGVIDILTYENVGDAIKTGSYFGDGGYVSTTIRPLASPKIAHAGEIVAVIVAQSFEAAEEAKSILDITYDEERPSATFGSPGAETVEGKKASKKHEDPAVGDAEGAFATSAVKVDANYSTPTQHHNPIELFTTLCSWDGGKLTVWESSENVHGFKNGLAEQFGLAPDMVHIVSPFVGGAFGSRGALTQRTALIALAAKRIGRPVKLMASRKDGFTIATYRAETRQRLRLGASPDGKLQSLNHEGFEVTSRADPYMVAGTDATTRLYACANVASNVSIVHVDRPTPGFMRAPAETPYIFGLESAMDELAVALKMDPIELRRINDTQIEPIKGLRYSSRSLMPCFDAAAERFGWSRRNPEPSSMRDGDWLIGWGCATAMYPAQIGPATARVSLLPDGRLRVQTAGHEIGNGLYTVAAMIAAERLGVPLAQVSVELGDSNLPPAPVAGGSNSTASICNVVAKACDDIRHRIAMASVEATDSPLKGVSLDSIVFADAAISEPNGRSESLVKAAKRVSNGAIEAYAENNPHGAKPNGVEMLYAGKQDLTGGTKLKDSIQFSFGAQFVEVHVHSLTREIRVPRLVGAFAAGRIMNQRTARSQLMGGMIWGVSSALHEATEIDVRAARYTNTDLAEYMVPVNADIEQTDVIIIPEHDTLVNALGIKGVGELGIVGGSAAVANAVYHATGVRVRDLPIRLEKLLVA